jgi:hypothetical protein
VNLGSWFDGPKVFFLSADEAGFVPVEGAGKSPGRQAIT